MPSVKIKNMPINVYRVLRRRAADAGQFLQEYLLVQLTRQAREETLAEALESRRGRVDGSVGLAFSVETLKADRKRTD